MSLLIFQHYPTQVAIFTDTLATTPEGEALLFCNKCFVYPHLNMTMAVIGILQLADKWNSKLTVSMIAKDIDMLYPNEIGMQTSRQVGSENYRLEVF